MAHRQLVSRKGQAIVLITLISLVMFAILGLVIDIGWAHFRMKAAQAAADGAALAAVAAAAQTSANGGNNLVRANQVHANTVTSSLCNPVCGSTGIACQGATTCPANIS